MPFQICKSFLQSSNVELCTTASFTNPKAQDLVLVCPCMLQVFTVQEKESDDVPLHLVASFPIHGTPTSMAVIPRTEMNLPDVLMLSFEGGKVSIVEFDPLAEDLRTLEVFDFGFSSVYSSCYKSYPIRSYGLASICPIRVDPNFQCVGMLISSTVLVLLPLRNRDTLPSSKEPSAMLQLHEKIPDGYFPWADESLFDPPTFVDLGLYLPGKRIEGSSMTSSITDFQFLNGYTNPTIVFLSNEDRGSDNLGWRRKFSHRLVALSFALRPPAGLLEVEQQLTSPSLFTATQIWNAEELPTDSIHLLPLPVPLCGTLVFTMNAVIYVAESSKLTLPVNGFAGVTVQSDRYPIVRDSQGFTDAITLDGARSHVLSEHFVLISSRGGELYLLSLEFQSQSLDAMQLYSMGSCSPAVGMCLIHSDSGSFSQEDGILNELPSFVFVGSRLGSSHLLGVEPPGSTVEVDKEGDVVEEEMDVTIPLGDTGATEGTEQRLLDAVVEVQDVAWSSGRPAPFHLSVVDSLATIGPIASVGLAPLHITSGVEPSLQLMMTAGHQESSSLACGSLGVGPSSVPARFPVTDCQGVWWIEPPPAEETESEEWNAFLLIGEPTRTRVLKAGAGLEELASGDAGGIAMDLPTLAVISVFEERRVIQITARSVRQLVVDPVSGAQCLGELMVEDDVDIGGLGGEVGVKIIGAIGADPYVLIFFDNGKIRLLEADLEDMDLLVREDLVPSVTGSITAATVHSDVCGNEGEGVECTRSDLFNWQSRQHAWKAERAQQHTQQHRAFLFSAQQDGDLQEAEERFLYGGSGEEKSCGLVEEDIEEVMKRLAPVDLGSGEEEAFLYGPAMDATVHVSEKVEEEATEGTQEEGMDVEEDEEAEDAQTWYLWTVESDSVLRGYKLPSMTLCYTVGDFSSFPPVLEMQSGGTAPPSKAETHAQKKIVSIKFCSMPRLCVAAVNAVGDAVVYQRLPEPEARWSGADPIPPRFSRVNLPFVTRPPLVVGAKSAPVLYSKPSPELIHHIPDVSIDSTTPEGGLLLLQTWRPVWITGHRGTVKCVPARMPGDHVFDPASPPAIVGACTFSNPLVPDNGVALADGRGFVNIAVLERGSRSAGDSQMAVKAIPLEHSHPKLVVLRHCVPPALTTGNSQTAAYSNNPHSRRVLVAMAAVKSVLWEESWDDGAVAKYERDFVEWPADVFEEGQIGGEPVPTVGESPPITAEVHEVVVGFVSREVACGEEPFDRSKFEVTDSQVLTAEVDCLYHHITSMKEVILEDEATKRQEHYLAVCTGQVPSPGEDVLSLGEVHLYSIEAGSAREDDEKEKGDGGVIGGVGSEDLIAKLSLMYVHSDKTGPVMDCCSLRGCLAFLSRRQVHVMRWIRGSFQQIGFYDCEVFPLFLEAVKDFVVVGDLQHSIQLLRWKHEGGIRDLSLLSHDMDPLEVTHVTFHVDQKFLGMIVTDAHKNVHLYSWDPAGEESCGGTRLVCEGAFHIGSMVLSTTRYKLMSVVAAPVQRRWANVFGTADGTVGVVIPVEERMFVRLRALATVLSEGLPQRGGIHPTEFRECVVPHRRLRNLPKTFLDGDLLSQYLTLDSHTQQSLARLIGSSVHVLLDNLQEIDLATRFF